MVIVDNCMPDFNDIVQRVAEISFFPQISQFYGPLTPTTLRIWNPREYIDNLIYKCQSWLMSTP